MELPKSLLATDIHVNASYDSMDGLFAQVEKEERGGIVFTSGKAKKEYSLGHLKSLHRLFLENKNGLMTIPSGNSIHMRNQEVLDLLRGNGVREMKRKIEDENLPACFEVIKVGDDSIITVKFDYDKAGTDFPKFGEKTLEDGMTIRQLEFYLAVLDHNYDLTASGGQAVVDSEIKPDMLIFVDDELKPGEFVVGFKPSSLIAKIKS